MYLKVQNVGEIPIHGIRLLGHTAKNESQIGKFGTGLKEAITLLIRHGASPIIFSGLIKIDFAIHVQDKVKEIHMRLSESIRAWKANTWHGLGISPEFGKLDWGDLWQALREVYCNAYDEESEFAYVLGDLTPHGVVGETRVYIPADDELVRQHALVEQRLLFTCNPKVEFENHYGRILTKNTARGNGLHIYHKQVWVQSQGYCESLFDYELSELQLNEARSADWYSVNIEASQLLASANIPILKRWFREVNESIGLWESTFSAYSMRSTVKKYKDNWKEAWAQLYGPKAVVTINDSYYIALMLKKGYKPIIVSCDTYRHLFEEAGILTWEQILNEDERAHQEIIQEDLPTAREVWACLARHNFIEHADYPDVYIFTEKQKDKITCGYAKEGGIYINADIIGSKMERITILEEMVHHITNAADHSRQMQSWLFEKLDTLLWK